MSYKFPTSVGGQDLDIIMEMLRRFNEGEIDLSDDQAEKLAEIAYQMNAEFNPRSKSIRKGLFDLVDTAAFGLVPNKLRPYSVGQELHGESPSDKLAGYLGTGAGLLTGVGGAYKVATNIPKVASAVGAGVGKTGQAISRAGKQAYSYAQPKVKSAYNYAQPRVKSAYDKTMNYGSDFLSRASEANRANQYTSRAMNRTADFLSRGAEYGAPRIKQVASRIKESASIERAANNVRNFYNGRKRSVILDQYGNPIR